MEENIIYLGNSNKIHRKYYENNQGNYIGLYTDYYHSDNALYQDYNVKGIIDGELVKRYYNKKEIELIENLINI